MTRRVGSAFPPESGTAQIGLESMQARAYGLKDLRAGLGDINPMRCEGSRGTRRARQGMIGLDNEEGPGR